jgi:hypothetical protein
MDDEKKLSKQEKNLIKRKKVLDEVLATEKSYIDSLNKAINVKK